MKCICMHFDVFVLYLYLYFYSYCICIAVTGCRGPIGPKQKLSCNYVAFQLSTRGNPIEVEDDGCDDEVDEDDTDDDDNDTT